MTNFDQWMEMIYTVFKLALWKYSHVSMFCWFFFYHSHENSVVSWDGSHPNRRSLHSLVTEWRSDFLKNHPTRNFHIGFLKNKVFLCKTTEICCILWNLAWISQSIYKSQGLCYIDLTLAFSGFKEREFPMELSGHKKLHKRNET